jgi:transposase
LRKLRQIDNWDYNMLEAAAGLPTGAGPELAKALAQVIVSKFADHQPLHRQERIFQRQGVPISRKTMGGWLPAVTELLKPLY